MKKELIPNGGIPRSILFVMAVTGGLTVANLYYNQPLLETMRQSLGATELQANLITFITQLGYALGLIFVVPLADKVSRRKIVSLNMCIAVVCCIAIALARSIWIVWGASIILGCNSVVPQMFVPVANHFSKPENKSRNMGIVLTGLLSGVLGARVLSGYIGEWAGWRTMFGIAAVIMTISLAVILRTLPAMPSSFTGSYGKLMKSVVRIYLGYPPIRFYALRGGLSFGSMMAVWSCMAFHLSGAPFHAGSDAVGLLGLCGLAGAAAASGIGKFIPRFGIERFCYAGVILQLIAWGFAIFLSDTYVGLIIAIMLVDVGAQCQQLSNQSGCLAMVPEATNRCNTVFMSHLFAGGSLGTLSAGVAWDNMGWTGVCLVGIAFALLSLLVSLLFNHQKNSITIMAIEHKCKITVLECKCFNDYQEKYLADPKSGPCPCFKPGDTFLLERNGKRDDFYHMLDGKFCSEAWDAISRYVYTALQGGSIMKGWTNDEKMMIACCSDGTRPVIFKIERIDEEVEELTFADGRQ